MYEFPQFLKVLIYHSSSYIPNNPETKSVGQNVLYGIEKFKVCLKTFKKK